MKNIAAEKQVFFVVDESQISGKKYINILFGTLDEPNKTYLYDCLPVETVNHEIICQTVDDAARSLNIQRANFLLLISDAARYMTSAAKTLRSLFPHLLHVTCVSHLLHNCAMIIKAKYPAADNVIAAVKALTVKNAHHRRLFDDIGQPPKPVVTRWGT